MSHDQWLFSDFGIAVSPDARQLALNLATWFSGGKPGKFLGYGAALPLGGSELAATLRAAGHSWTVAGGDCGPLDALSPSSLDQLLQYDAVFLAGLPVDNQLLIDYIHAGGGVFLAGGTGCYMGDAALWNTFLEGFGLRFRTEVNQLWGRLYISSGLTLFTGVWEIYQLVGNTIDRLDTADSDTEIVVPYDSGGLFATYTGGAVPVAVDVVPGVCPNRLDTASRDPVRVAVLGSSKLDVSAITPASIQILDVAPRFATRGDVSGFSWRFLGKTNQDACADGRADGWPDLVLHFDRAQLIAAIELALGRSASDGDVVALTLSGTLTSGKQIVGEDLVVLVVRTAKRK